MTVQHFFYIPIIFLLGLVFGTMINKPVARQTDQIQYKTSKKNLIQAFLIFFIVFAVTHIIDIPWGAKAVSQQLGGIDLFDKSPVFASENVYGRIRFFTPEGINAYKRFTYTIDIIFPVSFLVFLLTFARFVSQRKNIHKYVAVALVGLPVLWFTSDVIENVFIFTILSSYPVQNKFLGNALGFITAIKFGLLLLSILAPTLLLIFKNKSKAGFYQT